MTQLPSRQTFPPRRVNNPAGTQCPAHSSRVLRYKLKETKVSNKWVSLKIIVSTHVMRETICDAKFDLVGENVVKIHRMGVYCGLSL